MEARGPLRRGQRVRVREGVDRYGGMFGTIIHREPATGDAAYASRRPLTGSPAGGLVLVVSLEDPGPGLEPVILCYEEQLVAVLPAG